MTSEDIKKLGNYAVTTKDVEELVELVMRLMEELSLIHISEPTRPY